MTKIVAVLGATSQTGKHLVRMLVEQNLHVRVLSRSLSKARKIFGDTVEIIEGDLIRVKDLRALVDGVTHLFALHRAGIYPDERGYELIDFGGMDKALDSIQAEQSIHIIYNSATYPEHLYVSASSFFKHEYWIGLTEKMLQKSGLPYSIVKPRFQNMHKGSMVKVEVEQAGQEVIGTTWEKVAIAMIQAMYQETAKGKVIEVSNKASTAGHLFI